MRRLRLAGAILALALIFVGSFVAGAAYFKEGPVIDALRSPDGNSGSDKAE